METAATFFKTNQKYSEVLASCSSQSEIVERISEMDGREKNKTEDFKLPGLKIKETFLDEDSFKSNLYLALRARRGVSRFALILGNYDFFSKTGSSSIANLPHSEIAKRIAKDFISEPRAIGLAIEIDKGKEKYDLLCLKKGTREDAVEKGFAETASVIKKISEPYKDNPKSIDIKLLEDKVSKALLELDWNPTYYVSTSAH